MDVKLARRRRRMVGLAMAAPGSFKIIKDHPFISWIRVAPSSAMSGFACEGAAKFVMEPPISKQEAFASNVTRHYGIVANKVKTYHWLCLDLIARITSWELKMEQYLRVSEGKASPKRDFRALLRGRNHRSLKSNLPESIGQVNGGCVVSHTNENGFVRMKLVVRKQDLKQMLEVMRGGKSNANQASYSPVSSLSLEQRLNLLRRKHLSRSNSAKGSCRRSWTPALQSIPE
ncbi:hypothetical protein H0E87_008146 [Populus deltoides]|nr:hypothetical protein H0E87_008146 [Populus deltoides]